MNSCLIFSHPVPPSSAPLNLHLLSSFEVWHTACEEAYLATISEKAEGSRKSHEGFTASLMVGDHGLC